MIVKLKAAKRFKRLSHNQWKPVDGGFGHLFLAGESVDIPDEFLHLVSVDIPKIKPTDFPMADKQVTESTTKTVTKKKKVKRRYVKDETMGRNS